MSWDGGSEGSAFAALTRRLRRDLAGTDRAAAAPRSRAGAFGSGAGASVRRGDGFMARSEAQLAAAVVRAFRRVGV